MTPARSAPTEFRVRGRLGDAALTRFVDAFGELEVAETVLVVEVTGHSRLQGVISLLEELGLELIEVRRLTRRHGD